ncbi:hypothetical protein BC828DRAFT_387049 [Blastocladiella britannica]|nr:hypothetical protein BC828DRAFT_387049 [Blastocladiella britannica]
MILADTAAFQQPPPPAPAAGAQSTARGGPTTRQAAALVLGLPTNVVLQSFADRTVVLVTQLGKVGSLIMVEPAAPEATQFLPSSSLADFGDPSSMEASEAMPVPVHDRRLLGPESALNAVYAADVARLVARHGLPTPVLVGIALRQIAGTAAVGDDEYDDSALDRLAEEAERMHAILAMVEELIAGRPVVNDRPVSVGPR